MSTHAKVTREHRIAALVALGAYQADPNDEFDQIHYQEQLAWLVKGGQHNTGDHDFVNAEGVAQAIADAEERGRDGGVFAGRAAERADVIAECERTERLVDSESMHSIMAMRVRIQRGEHVRSTRG